MKELSVGALVVKSEDIVRPFLSPIPAAET